MCSRIQWKQCVPSMDVSDEHCTGERGTPGWRHMYHTCSMSYKTRWDTWGGSRTIQANHDKYVQSSVPPSLAKG